eukprot:767405-Hanusia_phi.AAC.4
MSCTTRQHAPTCRNLSAMFLSPASAAAARKSSTVWTWARLPQVYIAASACLSWSSPGMLVRTTRLPPPFSAGKAAPLAHAVRGDTSPLLVTCATFRFIISSPPPLPPSHTDNFHTSPFLPRHHNFIFPSDPPSHADPLPGPAGPTLAVL